MTVDAARSDVQRRAATLAAITVSLLLIAAPGSAAAQEVQEASGEVGDLQLGPAPVDFTCHVCPDSRVRFRELEAARPIDWKLALAAAMRVASQSRAGDQGRRFGQPGPNGEYVFANTPRQVAQVVRSGFGASSLVTRGVDAVAALADLAERTTQVPLDGINFVSDAVVEEGRRLGLKRLPQFHLHSKIETDRAGVLLSASW